MTNVGEIPAFVLANAQKRLQAARIRKMCLTPGCENQANHWPATGAPACETHRVTFPAVPDPARTLDGLRRAAGLPVEVRPGFRTVSDERVEAKGQRVSVARRAAARGDT